jgi:Ca-activated chloride channel family protein
MSNTTDALSVRALLERSSIRPGKKDELHLVVDVKATGAPVDAARPSLSVVFVLDTSGSMNGEPLEQVIRSVEMLADLLAPEDKVGVVAFSNQATEVCPLAALTPDTRRVLKRRVNGMRAGGGTNIQAGLEKAASMFGARDAHERQIVLLLSDGQPNDGASAPDDLAALASSLRKDASISTLGFGAAHNADVLHGVSVAGGGQYWFISDPDEADVEFARALGAQGDVVADQIELVLAPLEKSEVTGVLGHKVRFTREGPATSLPDLRQDARRLVTASVVVDAPVEAGRLDVLDVIVRYQAAGQSAVLTLTERVRIDVVDKEPQLVVEAHQAAMMARAELARGEARQAADRGNWDQAAGVLRAMIAKLQAVPGYVAADGSPLSECVEQLIDDANEYEQRPSAERYAVYKATQRGVEVSQGAKAAAAMGAQSARTQAILAGITGAVMPGAIVVRDKNGNEMNRVPILPLMSVGRSPENEICIASSSLSRRHTGFLCKGGMLLVRDMGSTNGTILNGTRVTSMAQLKHGDKVQLGDYVLEIELK